MTAQYIKLYQDNPEEKKILKIVDILKKGGLIIYPSDTIYSIGCNINNQKAMENLAKLKGTKLEKAKFSFICKNIAEMASYTKPIDKFIFKKIKSVVPGPFTFILEANNNLPSYYKKKKEVGIRIPNNKIPLQIVEYLGCPLSSTSVHDEDEIVEYTTDADLIYEKYKKKVDLIINGGKVNLIPSTIIKIKNQRLELIRQGLGNFNLIKD